MNLLLTILTVIVGLSQAWQVKLDQERFLNRRTGDNFFVLCKVKEYDGAASDVKIEWFRDGQQILNKLPYGSMMTIERTYMNQLMINRPKTTDGGKYTCKAEIGGETQEVEAEISFVDPPKFVNPQEEQHPEEGTRAEIHCEVEGTDQLEVFWQFNHVTLDETSQRGYEFSEDRQKLYIPHFTAKKDDGIYNCNAAQFSSFETLSINVTGYARPTITVFDVPEGNRGLEGHTVELKCGAVAKPRPSYKWYFEGDDVPLVHSDKHRVEEGLLVIESLNSEDIGTYKCIANNSVGSDERSVQLSVFLKPKVETQSEYVKQEGQDVEIICGYQGDGEMHAKFVYGTQEFAVQEHRPKSDEIEETTQSSEASESEEDEEVIETTTEIAEKSGEASSSVEVTPSAETTPQDENEDDAVPESNDEEKAEQEGEEEEKEESRKWKRFVDDINNERISVRAEDNKIILTIKSLSLEDAGSYQCLVSNEAGTTNKTAQVSIIHPPTLRHYTGSQIRSYEGHTVSIFCDVSAVPEPKWKWMKDGDEVDANGGTIQIDTHGTSTKLTLQHEKNSDNYGKYTCHADNGVGVLEKQIEVVHVVSPPTPSAMDCKKFMYPNYGKCSFEEGIYSEEGRKPLKMEFLIAKMEEMESDYNWDDALHVVSDFEEETKIANLSPSTQYMIKARATNEAGSSDYTPETSLETTDPWAPQAPSPVKVECADICVVSWSAPNDHGSPILKYKITLQEMGVVPKEGEKQEETAEINELEAETSAEVGETSTVDPEDDARVLPTSETHEETSNSQETSQEEEEQNHEVHRVPIGHALVIEVPAENTELHLTQIKPHSYYRVDVAAINSVGQGEPSGIEHQTFETPLKYEDGLATSNVVLAVAVGFLFVLLIIDFICFLTNRCGVIACICLNYCGKNNSRKQRDLEAGDGPESNRLLDSAATR